MSMNNTKKEILNRCENVEVTTARNSMGCTENWYNPSWALVEVFGIEKLMVMSETELQNLARLAEEISEGLY